MSYAEITNPIKISISQSSVAKLDNFLRRMCIISAGDTKLEDGEYREVFASNYTEIFDDSSNETINKLKGFFAFASTKPVIVLEVGNGEIKEQVEFLRNFINAGKSKSYMHLVPDSWYYPNESYSVISSDKPALHLAPTSLTLPIGQSFTFEPTYNGEITYALSDTNNFSLSDNVITGNENGTAGETATLTLTITLNNETITQEINLTLGNEGSEIIQSGEITTNYNYTRDVSFSDFASEFVSTESNVYFIVKSNNELGDSDSWALYKGKKSVFVIYDNLTTAYPLSSVALGIMASSQYDLSATQKATPLNNKSINGVSYNELGQVLMDDLTQQPLNFAGDFAGTTVLFNGRYASGDTWEYLYQSDLVVYKIQEAISTLLLNSANNSNYVLQFNQVGIDVLNATIKGALDNCISLGILSDFGTNFNITTGLIENSGYVYTVDFDSYKTNYADDYANERYAGVSFAMQIGRYIKEINISISRG